MSIVGAGGIGATLNTAMDRYEYGAAATVLLIIIVIVMLLNTYRPSSASMCNGTTNESTLNDTPSSAMNRAMAALRQ